MNVSKDSTVGSLLWTLVPSGLSFVVGTGVGTVVLGVYILAAAWSSGLIFPNVLAQDSENWISVTVMYLMPPVVQFFRIGPVAVVTIALMWAAVGMVSYLLLSKIVAIVRAFHAAKRPSFHFYALWVLWHAIVVAIAVGIFWLFQPFMAVLFSIADAAWLASSWEELFVRAAWFIAGWFVVTHAYTILLRLYKNYYLF